MIWNVFIAALAAASASSTNLKPASSLNAGAFELYSKLPALTVDPVLKVVSTISPSVQGSTSGTRNDFIVKKSSETDTEGNGSKSDPIPNLTITKDQLEQALGSALDIKFNLEILTNRAGYKLDYDKNSNAKPQVLGEIPVHLKVHRLTIGGVLIPTMTSKSIDEEQGPVNYGNIL